MKDILCDSDLLQIFLPGVGVVGIHDHSGVGQIQFVILILQVSEILIVIVWNVAAEFIHISTKDAVGQRVALGLDFPSAIQELLRALCSHDGIHHDRDISAGGILQSRRYSDAACHDTVLLVLHGPCTDGDITKQIGKIAVVFRIQHLLGTGKAGLPGHIGMKLPNGNDACQHVFFLFRIRLVEHPLVTDPLGTGLVGIDTGNEEQLVLDLLLHLCQTVHVIQNGVLAVSGARTDDQKELVALSGEDICDLAVPFFFCSPDVIRNRELFFEILRIGQFPDKFHLHFHNNHLVYLV